MHVCYSDLHLCFPISVGGLELLAMGIVSYLKFLCLKYHPEIPLCLLFQEKSPINVTNVGELSYLTAS